MEDEALLEKLESLSTPGGEIICTQDEAEQLGAFEEDAITLEDVANSWIEEAE